MALYIYFDTHIYTHSHTRMHAHIFLLLKYVIEFASLYFNFSNVICKIIKSLLKFHTAFLAFFLNTSLRCFRVISVNKKEFKNILHTVSYTYRIHVRIFSSIFYKFIMFLLNCFFYANFSIFWVHMC